MSVQSKVSGRTLTEDEIKDAVARMVSGETLGDLSERLQVSAMQLQMWRKQYAPQAPIMIKRNPETVNITEEPKAQEEEVMAKKKVKKKKTRTENTPHETKLQAIRRCYRGEARKAVADSVGVCVQTIDLWKRNHGHEIQAENKAKQSVPKEAPVQKSKAIAVTHSQPSSAPLDRDTEIRNLKVIIANLTLENMKLKGEI